MNMDHVSSRILFLEEMDVGCLGKQKRESEYVLEVETQPVSDAFCTEEL